MGTVDDTPPPSSRDFKKNRNQSTTSAGSGNPSSSVFSQGLNSPSMQNKPPHPPSLAIGNMNSLGSRQNGYPDGPKSPTMGKVGDDHRLVMDGIKLAM